MVPKKEEMYWQTTQEVLQTSVTFWANMLFAIQLILSKDSNLYEINK